ncbi:MULTISPECIES: hypothetical protein [unclassified Streptomyces]|uniref:hypothetical protein n=1 Tax=unclassified Streptomyces TaxID=2593676 RepID=UPI00365D6DBD
MTDRDSGAGPDGAGPDWRTVLAGLPDGEEGPPPGVSRRRWHCARRRDLRRLRAGTAAELRGRPLSPLVLLLVVAVLLVLGLLSRCGSPGPGDDARPATTTPAVPSAPAALPAPPAPEPAPDDTTGPDSVAGAWVRAYLSRDPLVDGSHRPSVERAAAWATADLTRSLLRSPAPGWGRQVSRGETTTVESVAVRPGGPDLPPDNAAQVWRTAEAQVSARGYAPAARRAETLQVEVMLTTVGWRVSRVVGV